jgi:hypothetical protein
MVEDTDALWMGVKLVRAVHLAFVRNMVVIYKRVRDSPFSSYDVTKKRKEGRDDVIE